MIEINGLTKRYGDVFALNDVSFSVKKGQIVGFLGANGAGKTTTMDILCGCLGADAGTVKVNGFDVAENPEKAKASIGYLPDEPPLYSDMRVEEYVSYAAQLRKVPRDKIKQSVDSILQKLSIENVRHRMVGNLSKGYKQRVGLAQALVHDPKLLVLDEPTEGLDPNQIVQIRELIKSLAGQHTILLSSHILSEVQNTCDHIVIINEGKIVQQGSYEELVVAAEAGDTYNVEVAKSAQKLAEDLRSITNISSVEISSLTKNRLLVRSNDGDSVLTEVVSKIISGGYGLREISSTSKNLEGIFFKLTK